MSWNKQMRLLLRSWYTAARRRRISSTEFWTRLGHRLLWGRRLSDLHRTSWRCGATHSTTLNQQQLRYEALVMNITTPPRSLAGRTACSPCCRPLRAGIRAPWEWSRSDRCRTFGNRSGEGNGDGPQNCHRGSAASLWGKWNRRPKLLIFKTRLSVDSLMDGWIDWLKMSVVTFLADTSFAIGAFGPGADAGGFIEDQIGRARVETSLSVDAVDELMAVGLVRMLEETVASAAVLSWLRLLCETKHKSTNQHTNR